MLIENQIHDPFLVIRERMNNNKTVRRGKKERLSLGLVVLHEKEQNENYKRQQKHSQKFETKLRGSDHGQQTPNMTKKLRGKS